MRVMPLPSLIVINTSTSHHHIPDDEPRKLTPQAIEMFLDHIHNDTAQVIIVENKINKNFIDFFHRGVLYSQI